MPVYPGAHNRHRLHGQVGDISPAELEATYRQLGQAAVA
jgi:hypothetical protein